MIKSLFFWQSSAALRETLFDAQAFGHTYLMRADVTIAIPFPVKVKQDLNYSLHTCPLALTDYKWNVREHKL